MQWVQTRGSNSSGTPDMLVGLSTVGFVDVDLDYLYFVNIRPSSTTHGNGPP